MVVGTVLAEADGRRLAPRSGARVGDAVVLTGTAGRGGAAAARLGSHGPTPAILRALLRVEPRIAEGRALVRFAHAMLDTSDGVAESARLLSEASGVRVELDLAKIPRDPALATVRGGDAREAAVFYGGDYELIAAIPADRVSAALRSVRAAGGTVTVVGAVGPGQGAFLRRGESAVPMPRAGWDPFAAARGRVSPWQSAG